MKTKDKNLLYILLEFMKNDFVKSDNRLHMHYFNFNPVNGEHIEQFLSFEKSLNSAEDVISLIREGTTRKFIAEAEGKYMGQSPFEELILTQYGLDCLNSYLDDKENNNSLNKVRLSLKNISTLVMTVAITAAVTAFVTNWVNSKKQQDCNVKVVKSTYLQDIIKKEAK